VEPKQKFKYDSLYRLIEAEGREHTALNNPDYYKDTNAFKQSAFITITDANDANRLANYTRRYTYDKAGNMLTIQHIAANSARSFTRTIRVDENSNRWLPANMGNDLQFNNYYDSNGNILELETVQEITWNYRDNISSAVLLKRESGINDAEYYVYDASGQRIRKVRETVTNTSNGTYEVEEKIYLGGVEVKRIRTVQASGTSTILNRTTLHIMDDKRRIAVVHNWSTDSNSREVNSSSDLNTNKIRYQYGNHLDSASLELSSTGSIISYEEYFPYGDTSLIAGTNQKEVKLKEYRYTGKEKDDATGLYYYGARYYASWLGRWLSADPLFRENPSVYERPKRKDEDEQKRLDEEYKQQLYSQGLNLYYYVAGNPVRHSDPTGLIAPLIVLGIIIAAKVFDYGWTAYDIRQSQKTLNNDKASFNEKFVAATNIVLAIALEAGEPDEVSPISLPADDIIRKVGVKKIEKELAERGTGGVYQLLRKEVGTTKAQEFFKQIYKALGKEVEFHHLLPQGKKFTEFFKRAKLDIQDFVIPLETGKHRLKSGGGVHTGPDNWNKAWETFMEKNPHATQKQILEHLAVLRKKFGI